MKKYLFILGFIFLLANVACKDDDTHKTRLTTEADSLRLSQKRQRVISDEQRIKDMLRVKNNNLSTEDSIYYKAKIKRPIDSVFLVMNLYGKAKKSGKLEEFKQTAVIKDNKTITSRIDGSVFRIDKTADNSYKIYTHNVTNNSFSAYDIDFKSTPVSIRKATRTANFYFDLLPKKTFNFNIDDADKFFTIRKDRLIKGDSILDTLASGANIYRSNGLLDLQDATALNTFYFVDSTRILEKLIIRNPKRVLTNITLSGEEKVDGKHKKYSSVFVNDSVFKAYEISEEQDKNSEHVVAYKVDSVIKNYSYNKDFNFSLKTIDSFDLEYSYPQYYESLIDTTFFVYSKPFEINQMHAKWRYSVRYTRKTNANPTKVEVSVSKRDMIRIEDTTFVFEAPLSPIKKPMNIGSLSEQNYDVADFDINFDGYTDLSFPEGFDLNRNTTYAVYLYQPETNTFIKTPAFTGPSMAPYILIDKDNRSAIYTSSTGNNNYSARIIRIGDKGEILYKETYWSTNSNDKISIHYQKTQNSAVVEKSDDIAKGKVWNKGDFKNEFLSWIREQIIK
ncbi:hypothetical protein JM658_04170 [Joostella atrarenae]|uniref:Uncharacterized protein n=1 Tax=Joostella atrarenae TaxID=679257 RepID=A0ABS9J101_9FLAO|nr:hypothetical protein [Joostella atrarenae]MCF8714015.1 hypothetical protein [Joostella atrarenae]